MDDKKLEQRLHSLYMIIIIILVILAGRLWNLQIRAGDHYGSLAEGNRVRRIRVMPTRGLIMDRNSVELIRSRPAFTVSLVPGGIPENSQQVLAYLSEILSLTNEELAAAIEMGQQSLYEPVRVMRDVDPGIVVAIEENRIRLPGVFIEEEWVREYVCGDLTSHITGHLGIISANELKELGLSYQSSDLIGKAGIEALFERLLRGIPGAITVEVNALSRPIQTISYVEAIPGHNLVLSIDNNLQVAAKNAFIEYTEGLREEGDQPFKGTVIALDPNNGQILAMVSEPNYDAAQLIDASTRNTYYAGLINRSDMPMFNRAVQGQYGPGSALKPFIATAMLEEEVVSVNQVFNATGVSKYGVRDWVITQGLAPFGQITFIDALAVSSNHYFATFGTEVGIDRLSVWLKEFGFGYPTQATGVTQEASGLVPDREWKKQRFSSSPSYDQAWYPSDTEQVSIGQGFITVTPIQLAAAYSVIANRGVMYRPSLVLQIIDPQGNVAEEFKPEIIKELDVAASTWEAVIEGMEAVITHPRGTARNAFVDFPISVAGKTGSYEIPNQEAHGLFAAFAPIDEPEIVVVVIVEHGSGGGSSAAPIARKVLDAYFQF